LYPVVNYDLRVMESTSKKLDEL